MRHPVLTRSCELKIEVDENVGDNQTDLDISQILPETISRAIQERLQSVLPVVCETFVRAEPAFWMELIRKSKVQLRPVSSILRNGDLSLKEVRQSRESDIVGQLVLDLTPAS